MKTGTCITTIFLLALTACNPNDKNTSRQQAASYTTNGETFNQIPGEVIERLNKDIQAMKITTAEDVVNLYRPRQQEAEGRYAYTLHTRAVNHNVTEITLVEEGLVDDAVAGVKSVLTIEKYGSMLRVISVKENYKCYRGHKDWSAEKCL
jgi:tRNA U38,U39,U40 pseudouridine synthase TruA